MIAMAMIAFLFAAAPAQKELKNLENQEVEILMLEDAESEEIAFNEELELTDQIIFEDENETCEDEE